MNSERRVAGDLAPFAWAYRNCDFCIVTIYDKDIGALRDDLLFVAKRAGGGAQVAQERSLSATASGAKDLRSRIEIRTSGIICASGLSPGLQRVSLERSRQMLTSHSTGGFATTSAPEGFDLQDFEEAG